MWKKMFGKKEEKFVEEKKSEISADEANKAQDTPRTEPLQGTEKEIEKQAEDGMKEMGFTPVEENKEVNAQKEPEITLKPRPNGFKSRIRGNDYCPCGSNKKFKKCCALDEKKFKHFEKTMDIRVANTTVAKKSKNDIKRAKHLEEELKKTELSKVDSKV